MSQNTKAAQHVDAPGAQNDEQTAPASLFMPDDAKYTGRDLPEIVVYRDANFNGEDWRLNLPPGAGYSALGHWNDQISSVVVVSGTWEFYEHGKFGGARTVVGPGYYKYVEDPAFNMVNDTISSFRCLNDDEPVSPVVDI